MRQRRRQELVLDSEEREGINEIGMDDRSYRGRVRDDINLKVSAHSLDHEIPDQALRFFEARTF